MEIGETARSAAKRGDTDARAADPAIVVDLDGTLVLTDTLHESLLSAIGRSPVAAIKAMARLARGKAPFKLAVSQVGAIDVATLPYNRPLVDYLAAQARSGRRVVLATGADESIGWAVARHLGFVESVIASDGFVNVVGETKRQRIEACLADAPFIYIGDSRADLPVWAASAGAGFVNPSPAVRRYVLGRDPDALRFDAPRNRLVDQVASLRLHQWLKNLLVFVPMLAGHAYGDPAVLLSAMLAFLAFGLCASSTYVLNDALDLQFDRAHPRKRTRPLASGRMSIPAAGALAAGGLAAALLVALSVSSALLLLLAGYVVITLAYSLRLKRIETLDVFVLAGLYTLRMIAGAVGTGIVLSYWLLAFSMFLFLSLAMVKRVSEIVASRGPAADRIAGRGYRGEDCETLVSLGTASAFAATIVLALYLNAPDVGRHYPTPMALWPVCGLLLYWLCYTWVRARRGTVHDDPIVFALRDRTSRLVFTIIALFAAAATIDWSAR